jgi:hypothetical protein
MSSRPFSVKVHGALRNDDVFVVNSHSFGKEGNMKKALAFAAAAALCTTPAVLADTGWDPALDEPILINGGEPFSLVALESITFEVELGANNNPVIGFSFAGVIEGISGTAAWASDTRLDIVAPDGTSYDIGGFTNPSDNDWDFDGGGSTNDGLYIHGLGSPDGDGQPAFVFDKIAKGGIWSFTFTNDWSGAPEITWKGVSILLHKQSIPAPGVLALLGVVGLAGSRRRRA